MNAAHARIRLVYEQVRALEVEAVRPARRWRLPRVFFVVAAAAIGAASAGMTHPSAGREPVRAAAAVVHLIDRPAERARALPAAAPVPRRPVREARRTSARRPVRAAATVRAPLPTPVAHAAPPVAHAAAPPVTAPPAAPVAPRRAVEPVRPPAPPAPARPRPQPAVVPVGVGAVVVSTSEEPAPDSAGTTQPTAP